MKTINGNNKTERLLNKANKYLGLVLKEHSNKYFEINKQESNLDNKFITTDNNVKLIQGKYGPCLLIQSMNMENAIFVKTWKAMKSNYFGSDLIVFEYEKEIPETNGHDDIFKLNDYLDNNNVYFDKNAFYKA